MFDGSLPEIADLASLDDAELAAASAGWARVEAAAAARKLAVMAELFRRRCGCETAEERDQWWVDPTAAVGAELAAAQGVSHGMALSQAHRGMMLADRLPKVAALFANGLISDLLARTIVYRTALILAPEALAAVDADLAAQVTRWGALSAKKTQEAIDALIFTHDPAALRRARTAENKLTVEFGNPLDDAGYTSIWGRLYAPDATALEHTLDQMARSVCPDDPRTMNERRAAALGALPLGQDLVCECGRDDCTARPPESPRRDVVIHVVAHADAVSEARSQTPAAERKRPAGDDGPVPEKDEYAACAAPTQPTAEPEPAAAPAGEVEPAAEPEPQEPAPTPVPAVVLGGGALTGPVLAAFLARAKIRELRFPGDAPPEPRHQPSRALGDFIRARDLTCRFPGCDRPAHVADIDHTIPYPAGPTCASNLKCLCRFHHLLKTFWTGDNGWHDEQLPDGTVIWTAPTGHTHATRPGSALLFPTLCRPTALAITRPSKAKAVDRTTKMPRRTRTRAQNRAYRITAERKLNDDLVTERNRPPPF